MGDLSPRVSEADHVRGSSDAPATFVEYGDYECPSCGEAYSMLARLRREAGPLLRFVFRNFPLTQLHPHAELAAEAAESAASQGKFWEMHDLLFENQQQLAGPNLRSYAERIGLDLSRFERDLATHAFADRIREDALGGLQSGVNGTPSFFVNGVLYSGNYDLASLLDSVRSASS